MNIFISENDLMNYTFSCALVFETTSCLETILDVMDKIILIYAHKTYPRFSSKTSILFLCLVVEMPISDTLLDTVFPRILEEF